MSASKLTMEDLGTLAGVSAITVSRALRDSPLVTPATRARIRQLAAEQGYRLNVSARNLRMRRSHSVAVVVDMGTADQRPMLSPYLFELLGGITEELTMAGHSTVLTSRQLLYTAPVAGADAMILLGQGAHGEAVKSLGVPRMPLVVWGAPDGGSAHVTVGSDNRMGGQLAAERFLGLGRRKLLFIGDVGHAEVRERCEGLVEHLAGRAAVHVVVPESFSFGAGFDCLSDLLKAESSGTFDGLFAASDDLAMGAIRVLAESGLRVPDDVSVIGYDDIPRAASFTPQLTSVHQYLRLGGALLAKKALALIDGEQAHSEMLTATLIVRQT